MKLLALDTSGEFCSVAAYDGVAWHERCIHAGQTHSQRILPMVADCLAACALALDDLDGIAFGAGPGSFTGLRIACGVAQGLAFGASLPVVAVGTLEALAQASAAAKAIACLDARMGEVYHAAYVRGDAGWRCVSEPQVCAPQAVPVLPGDDWIGVGNGYAVYPTLAERYREQLALVRAEVMPTARAIGELALPRLTAGAGVAAALAVPIYLRGKVALTTAERAARLQ